MYVYFGELHNDNMCVSEAGTNKSFAMSNVVDGEKLFELWLRLNLSGHGWVRDFFARELNSR